MAKRYIILPIFGNDETFEHRPDDEQEGGISITGGGRPQKKGYRQPTISFPVHFSFKGVGSSIKLQRENFHLQSYSSIESERKLFEPLRTTLTFVTDLLNNQINIIESTIIFN